MVAGATAPPRARVDGKFFRVGEAKFHPRGVAYGPFADGGDHSGFLSPEKTTLDFKLIGQLGANVVRVYHVPPPWFLDLALEHGLRVFIDVPWYKKRCFLDSPSTRMEIRDAVRDAARRCCGHPAVFAFSVANEIPPEIVRWSGPRAVEEFIEQLVEDAKAIDPDCLCTFANFPPTEFLHPRHLDFVCFNVYLHHQRPFENYLARLQMKAEDKPLLLGEFGLDTLREGEPAQAEMLGWQIESAFRAGVAGTIVFTFTDEWHGPAGPVHDWAMGLTSAARAPKKAFFAVQKRFHAAPYFPRTATPKVSVVVACYNGARTLRACLDSLERLNYPDYEILLVDDGSTDATSQIAAVHKRVRVLRQDNHGLSVARNTGIAAATGEIIAFTDADCRADEDWLYHLVNSLLQDRYAGVGGHNFLPAEDSAVAAAVMASPGGPAHVMLNDRVAEHVPGCNMAFWKWALDEIGGFDPIFTQAGDDVDLCWRLQQRGYRIGFSPGGFVWHYRRSTVRAYLRQQAGYGAAEALLVRKHPEYFNSFGGTVWRGRIYGVAPVGVVTRPPIIYHGVFGTGFFQTLYAGASTSGLMFCTSLEYHVLVTLPLTVLAVPFRFLWPLAAASVLVSLCVCVAAAAQAQIPKASRRFWSRPLVALLYFFQPIERGWARYRGRLLLPPKPPSALEHLGALPRRDSGESLDQLQYVGDFSFDRLGFLNAIVTRLESSGWPCKVDSGWSDYDLEVYGNRWSRLQLVTATEDPGGMRRNFRVRLRSTWSLLAMIAFWGAFGFEMLIIGLLAPAQPWMWMLLLTMPIFGIFLEHERRSLQRHIAAFLDELARERGLTKEA